MIEDMEKEMKDIYAKPNTGAGSDEEELTG